MTTVLGTLSRANEARAQRIDVRPSGAALGAEIDGLDLREPLAADDVAFVRAALRTHKVLFFRDQDISRDDHIRFARHFGELEGHPVTQHVPGYPEMLSIRNGEYHELNETAAGFIRPLNKWHADVTFRAAPSFGAVLRARTIPPRGGDTLFADMEAVYEDLPTGVRERLDRLTATHDLMRSYSWRVADREREALSEKHPPVSHPVVRVHPETGRRSVFVNNAFTTRINDVEPSESDELLTMIYERIKCPEYQVRFKWTPNAVIFWDNRATQHYPVADYYPHERVVERVTIVGDQPVGVGR